MKRTTSSPSLINSPISKRNTNTNTNTQGARFKSRKSSSFNSLTPTAAPHYKLVPGTDFIVDGFKHKSSLYSHYFLTHFHADHYGGLTKHFPYGKIYCTPTTSKLVQLKFGVSETVLCPKEIGEEFEVNSVRVKFFDANHCPGAVLILFSVPIQSQQSQSQSHYLYLHTGDFRYCHQMKTYHELKYRKIDELYLDTTYCNEQYCFPLQEYAFDMAAHIVNNERAKCGGKLLFMFGTYSLGKERLLIHIAKTFNSKIYVQPS